MAVIQNIETLLKSLGTFICKETDFQINLRHLRRADEFSVHKRAYAHISDLFENCHAFQIAKTINY